MHIAVPKKIGLLGLTSVVVGSMVGSGILVISSKISVFGFWGVLGWICSSFCAISLAYSFAQLSRKFNKKSGIPFYISEAFGKYGSFLGFQGAWAHWFGLSMGCATVAIAFANYAPGLFPFIADGVKVYLAISIVWALIIMNCCSSSLSVGLISFITIVKVLLLFLVVLFSIPYFTWNKIYISGVVDLPPLLSVAKSMPLALFAFLGLEFATASSSSVANPGKTVPRATMLGTLIAAFVFIGIHLSVMSVLPQGQQIATEIPVYDTAVIALGKYGGFMISLMAVFGLIGGINGILFVSSHIVMNAASLNWFPKSMGKVGKCGFPNTAGIFSTALITLILLAYYKGFIDFEYLAYTSSFLLVCLYLMGTMAYLIHGGNYVIWAVNMIVCFILLFGSMDAFIPGITVLVVGALVYAIRKYLNN